MPAVVHGGTLGRWFEELCRIDVPSLATTCRANGCALQPRTLPDKGGVYAFWWTGPVEMLTSSHCNRLLELSGPGGRPVLLKLEDDWLGLSTGLPLPLYIGKNSSNISKRVGQHLRLADERMLPLGQGAAKQPRPTTSCQLRAGVEHLFPGEPDTRSLILKNVGLSFVVLDGDDHAANRFYLEDLAVGLMRPPLNVDIER
ncbi:MAG TPA: hypothetical protein VGD07_13140 [Methylomirabilota bacterium]|jgi:hypothetical protein